MRFEWDDAKAKANLAKHCVYIELAIQVFDDPLLKAEAGSVIDGEFRAVVLGATRRLTLPYVVYTLEHDDLGEVHRIISARKATRHERRLYETHA